jgi:hypothetical protein
MVVIVVVVVAGSVEWKGYGGTITVAMAVVVVAES